MKIELYFEDQYIEGTTNYPYRTITTDSWDRFWQLWNYDEEFVRCDDESGTEVYLKKDRVIELRSPRDEE
ncbi:hypothetical protein [Anaerococcus lactolyticus]|uniref:hypothetical protein n=1 Tax=Anaerococcus lactolyticus TaxID=33032 RepID=UPI00288B4CF1|nr:hypothetical protein [Anaerococcus lactolyticus]